MATSRRRSSAKSTTAARRGSSARGAKTAGPARAAKSARPAQAAKAAKSAKAAKTTAAAAAASTDMDFVMNAFRPVPAGAARVVFRIVAAGPQQSARLGVALFARVPPADFQPVDSKGIDNLPQTPDGASFEFVPHAGTDYVITFSGEMHSLSTANVPLTLALAVEAGGAVVEDFGGPRAVNQRFCAVAGRALLKVPS